MKVNLHVTGMLKNHTPLTSAVYIYIAVSTFVLIPIDFVQTSLMLRHLGYNDKGKNNNRVQDISRNISLQGTHCSSTNETTEVCNCVYVTAIKVALNVWYCLASVDIYQHNRQRV